jgi:hypothetical protein
MPKFIRQFLMFLLLLGFTTAGAITMNGNDPTTGQPPNSTDPSSYGTQVTPSPVPTTAPSTAQTTATSGVPFPEASAIKAEKSVCQTKRDKTFGNGGAIFNAGKTAENMLVTYNALPCPTTWLSQTVSAISTSGLPKYISALAYAVWFMGIIWTGVRIANGSEQSDGRELFARLLISGWLVIGSANMSGQLTEPKFSGNMGEVVRAGWVEAYKWGDATFATPALKRTSEQTNDLGENISRLVTLYAAVQVGSEALKSGAEATAAGTMVGAPELGFLGLIFGGGVGAANATVATTQAGIVAINMAMPILITYYLVIMGTGLATVIASLLIPLVGAMFIFSTGMGMQYAGTWFKTAASAVLMMALMPIVFAGSMELGFVEPAKNFNVATTRTEVALRKDVGGVLDQIKAGKVLDLKTWKLMAKSLGSAFNNAISKFDMFGYLNAMLTSLVLMAFSLIAGMYMLRIAQNWIIEFLGGVASAVTGGGAPNFAAALGSSARAVGNAASAVAGAPQKIAQVSGARDREAARVAKAAVTNSPTKTSQGGGTDPTGGGSGDTPNKPILKNSGPKTTPGG